MPRPVSEAPTAAAETSASLSYRPATGRKDAPKPKRKVVRRGGDTPLPSAPAPISNLTDSDVERLLSGGPVLVRARPPSPSLLDLAHEAARALPPSRWGVIAALGATLAFAAVVCAWRVGVVASAREALAATPDAVWLRGAVASGNAAAELTGHGTEPAVALQPVVFAAGCPTPASEDTKSGTDDAEERARAHRRRLRAARNADAAEAERVAVEAPRVERAEVRSGFGTAAPAVAPQQDLAKRAPQKPTETESASARPAPPPPTAFDLQQLEQMQLLQAMDGMAAP